MSKFLPIGFCLFSSHFFCLLNSICKHLLITGQQHGCGISVCMSSIQETRMYTEFTNSWGILTIEKSKCFCLPNTIWNHFDHHWPTTWFYISIGGFVFSGMWLYTCVLLLTQIIYTQKTYTTSIDEECKLVV